MPIDWDAVVLAPVVDDTFGEPVTYTPAGGEPFEITGVFSEGHDQVALLDDGPEATTARPMLGVRLAHFVSPPAQGDQVVIRGVTYAVAEPRPDSHGRATLILNYVSG